MLEIYLLSNLNARRDRNMHFQKGEFRMKDVDLSHSQNNGRVQTSRVHKTKY